MIYFYLVLLAAVFGLLGFFLHAFCFPAADDLKSRQKIESLQKELKERQTELRDARDRITRTNTTIRSLEQQVKQRNDEMEKLRKTASRQDVEIAALQKEPTTTRTAAANPKKAPDSPAKPGGPAAAPRSAASAGAAPESKSASKGEADKTGQKQPPPAQGGAAGPTWRENLKNTVGILDAMEKEIKK